MESLADLLGHVGREEAGEAGRDGGVVHWRRQVGQPLHSRRLPYSVSQPIGVGVAIHQIAFPVIEKGLEDWLTGGLARDSR